MQKVRSYFQIIVILLIVGYVRDIHATEPDTLAHRLAYQTWVYPQEKVYVATDKNIYVAGDTIRFRAFLVDALKLTQKRDGSKYIYVEVIDPLGEQVGKIKVKEKDGIFAGILPLPQEMAEGTYTLGGYTLFMKNQGTDFIFRKPLPIKSQFAKKYRLETSFEGNLLNTSFFERFGNKRKKASEIVFSSKDGIIRENIRNRTNFNFYLDSKILKEDFIKVSYDGYDKFVKIPKDTSTFSITFHPEGGYMVPGTVNKIAFKALDRNGLSKNVQGKVVNSDGIEVCKFASSHKGMGTFEMSPENNETYTAIIKGKSYNLPLPTPNASTLNVNIGNNDSISIKVNGIFNPEFTLIADNCGIVTYAKKLLNPELKICKDSIGSGLVQLYLLDKKDKIISSRLIFNRQGYIYNDSINAVPPGDYAVTSRKELLDSINTQSIVSELMLQGDLRGHIEEPDYYFIKPDSIKDLHLDNLMLTQGWKRYDIQNALNGRFSLPEEPMEIGGELTGTVNSRWKGKPLPGAVVNVLAPEINYVGVAETDSLGRYALNGLDWPDGTFFAVQAFNKKGGREHNHEVDIDVPFPFENLPEEYLCEVYDFSMFDNGAVWLQELEVTAPRSDEELRRDMLRALGVKTVTSEDIEKNNITSYEEVIRKIPGLTILNGNLVNIGARGLRSGGEMVELWVDGIMWRSNSSGISLNGGSDSRLTGGMPTPDRSYGDNIFNTFREFSESYPINIIESFQYYRPSIAMVISMSAAQNAGALVMTTKDGSKLTSWDHDLFIKRVTPKGYQNVAEVYEPHFTYDPTQESPTITSYWYPQVNNIDDIPKIENTKIIVEGITDSGLPFFGKIPLVKSQNQTK